jgi:hypothetical protein
MKHSQYFQTLVEVHRRDKEVSKLETGFVLQKEQFSETCLVGGKLSARFNCLVTINCIVTNETHHLSCYQLWVVYSIHSIHRIHLIHGSRRFTSCASCPFTSCASRQYNNWIMNDTLH